MAQSTDTDDDDKDLELTNAEHTDPKELLSNEQKRISLLDSAIASIIKEKIVVGADGKGMEVKLSSKEIRDLTAAQKDLNEMRRKNTGLGE